MKGEMLAVLMLGIFIVLECKSLYINIIAMVALRKFAQGYYGQVAEVEMFAFQAAGL